MTSETALRPLRNTENMEEFEEERRKPTTLRDTELETGGVDDGLITGKRGADVNVYQQKKTLAQGMMDLALMTANANQLRYVLELGPPHDYYLANIILIGISIFVQVAVGIGLIWNSTYNISKDQRNLLMANKVNNFTIIGIFIITVVNVFITAFGIIPNFETLPRNTELVPVT